MASAKTLSLRLLSGASSSAEPADRSEERALLRRAQAGDHLLGDADWHRDRLAASLFDDGPADP